MLQRPDSHADKFYTLRLVIYPANSFSTLGLPNCSSLSMLVNYVAGTQENDCKTGYELEGEESMRQLSATVRFPNLNLMRLLTMH